MKKLLLCCCVFIFFSCQNNEEKKIRAKQLISKSEYSQYIIRNLPLNLKFGMSVDDVQECVDSLIQEKILINLGRDSLITKNIYLKYHFPIQEVSYPVELKLWFYEQELYKLEFVFSSGRDSEEALEKLLTTLDAQYAADFEKEDYWFDDKIHFYYWIKDNMQVKLREDYMLNLYLTLTLSYINSPIEKILADIQSKKLIEDIELNKGNVEIKNSVWDGSVSQVEKYLKNNLKDPKSYESIEWSKVIKNKDYYSVRHKYRAKNSFGGYVVEEQIFYIDFKGNIIKVE